MYYGLSVGRTSALSSAPSAFIAVPNKALCYAQTALSQALCYAQTSDIRYAPLCSGR